MEEQETQNDNSVTDNSIDENKSNSDLFAVAEMRHKSLLRLIEVHLQNYESTLISSNGVSYKDKIDYLASLNRAIIYGLDFGIDLGEREIVSKGKFAKQEGQMAALIAQCLENRLVLLSKKLMEKENNSETKGDENEQRKETEESNNT